MTTKAKVVTSVVAVVLCLALVGVAVLTLHSNTKQAITAEANTRTVSLSQSEVDVQSVLNEFKNATLTKEGNTTYFEGYKSLDTSQLSQIDYISDSELEELENCTVKYNFSYNSETNVVTLYAVATLSDGTIEVDEIHGVGFINEKDEIDAVMNIDGEGVLLSEMRNAGLIQNCGWLSSIIKKVAVAVAVVAVVAVAVAAVVVTAGAAAPAVVAAGIGVSTAVVASGVAAAATIGTYAAITAAIAAGVALTAALWEQYYPDISVTVTNNQLRAQWNEKTKAAIRDVAIAEASKKQEEQKIYFRCIAAGCAPSYVDLSNIYTCDEMANMMRSSGASSITSTKSDARRVIERAANGIYPVYEELGKNHYHAADVLNPSYDSSRPLANNQRWSVGGYSIHSFWVV